MITTMLDQVVDEVTAIILRKTRHLDLDRRACLCGCGRKFKPTSDHHVWYSRACCKRGHWVRFNVREIRDVAHRRRHVA